MIDVRLKVFRCVATCLSFTKASQELFISQPAIPKHIQDLEKEYNMRLFNRMGNRIQLSSAGQLLLDHANRILNDYRHLDYDMTALQENVRTDLRIGASTTISQYVMPEVIALFRQQNPNLRITMLSGNSREVETALQSGRIDLGMVEGVIMQPQLKYTQFMNDEIVAIVSTKGALQNKEKISLDEFKQIPVVLREFGSGTLDVIQQVLSKKGVKLSDLNIEMNFGTTEGIKHYVEHSDCMGIVSIRSVNKELYGNIFKIVDIQGVQFNRKFSFVEVRGEPTGVTQRLKDFIMQYYNQKL